MKIHQLAPGECYRVLGSTPDGLATTEAARRLAEYGPNALAEIRRTVPWKQFADCFTHFFAVVLWVAASLALMAEWRAPGQGMATLSAAIAGVVIINGLFSFWQEYRAEKALESLRHLLPHMVTTIRDGHTQDMPVETLVPGDLILVEEGNLVPADCRLTESSGIRVNDATLSGESAPHSRTETADNSPDLADARNVLFAGSSVTAGHGRALVFATGGHTVFGSIAALSQSGPENERSPLQREIHWLSRLIAAMATTLGLVFFLVGQWMELGFWHNFVFAVGIIVANVPEGLLPTVTLSLAMASRRMAKRQAIIRHLPAIETLGCTTVICTDKTGTLTENRMTVRRLFVDGSFFDTMDQTPPLTENFEAALEVCGHCHDLRSQSYGGLERWNGDPMEIALREFAERFGFVTSGERKGEIPFDSDRKRQTVLHRQEQGDQILVKGAPETVLPLCRLTGSELSAIVAAQNRLAAEGYRVLALGWRQGDGTLTSNQELWEHDLMFAALVALEDPPRPDVREAIGRCREAGIRVIMITGDHPVTAAALAREIGLEDDPEMISGDRLRLWSATQLQIALDRTNLHFARVTAGQKSLIVAALKRKGHVVAATGDGVNDAPALRRADVGIAMGRTGTDVARDSADLVLLDDHFATIVAAIEEGRAVYENIRKFLTYILTSNVPEIVPYLAFVLFNIPLPLTIIQILAVDLGTDLLPALGLGAEKPPPGIMRQPPRDRKQRLLSTDLLLRAYGFLGPIQAIGALAAFFFVLNLGGWRYPEQLASEDPLYLSATTSCLTAIVAMQAVNVFLCRSDRESAFATGIFDNRLILAGVAVEASAMFMIANVAWTQKIFGTAPVPLAAIGVILSGAFTLFLLDESRKLFRLQHRA